MTVTTTLLSPEESPVSPVTLAFADGSVGVATTVTEVVPPLTTRTSPSSTSLPLIVNVDKDVSEPAALAAETDNP